MGPNELLREFEKYNQSPSAKYLLDTRKTKMFLQTTDNVLYDKLLLLFEKKSTEGWLSRGVHCILCLRTTCVHDPPKSPMVY